MKAEDTVMTFEQNLALQEQLYIGCADTQEAFDEIVEPQLVAQAEITFKAGAKELADWVEKNKKWEEEHHSGRSIGSPNDTGGVISLTETYYLISKDNLQAKLKELGISEDGQSTD